jgi:sugar transferase (PEP-CTERM/EpsH1 system associated)
MKILWMKSDFLHPTDRGGQIRSLETLRRLHSRHEIHYLAYVQKEDHEGPSRATEYCSFVYPVPFFVPPRTSPSFYVQLLRNLVSAYPLAVQRYSSSAMQHTVRHVLSKHNFDAIVCDFVAMAPNMPDLSRCVLFQHNVESMIWQRHADHAPDALRRSYFRSQARRMLRYEKQACRRAAHVIAVSEVDADCMRSLYGVSRISVVPTGVDLDYFLAPPTVTRGSDLVFVGAMDWLPNIDGARFFTQEVLPLIRRRRPDCSLVLAGRSPTQEIRGLAEADPLIRVTGTVPDIRPYLWGASASIVPLRIGGGTRLKIYESMAAGTPVVSTRVGAEGLPVQNGEQLFLADDPSGFAERCLELLEQPSLAERISGAARRMVTAEFSWDRVSRRFEDIIESVACSGTVK